MSPVLSRFALFFVTLAAVGCGAMVPFDQSGPLQVILEEVATGFTTPVYVADPGDGSGRLFVVEQGGTIRIIRGGQVLPRPFLDIRSGITSGGEMGLLSVAFHPRYASNGRFFVHYTATRGNLRSIIAEYRVSGSDPDLADPVERVVLDITRDFQNHNGGLNLFGPDGMLYIGLGDGGGAGDPLDSGQRLGTPLGKILRLDVDGGVPYRVPADNPFVGQSGALGEIWAYGFRNPWRFSFDRVNGRLFLGDVGQHRLEEIDIVEKGGNYGWRIREGTQCFTPPSGCSSANLRPPIAEYPTPDGCAVTGGYVYRGRRIPGLVGRYVYGDYCNGRISTLIDSGGGVWRTESLLSTQSLISSFGEDRDGEVYVVDHNGRVYRLAPR